MRFIYFTDVHLLENQDSVVGFEKCLEAMLACEPELMINGGDLGVTPEAVEAYHEMIRDVAVPNHFVNGNHEMCNQSLAHEDAGTFSRSWNHGGVHFIILDVVRYFDPTDEHPANWYGIADEANLKWLEEDLSAISHETPIVLACHIPLSTSFPHRCGHQTGMDFPTNEVTGAERVLKLLSPFANVATLHGHDHENCRHRSDNIQILTTAAVAGNWWRDGLNSPNQHGEPQGFRVIDVDDSSGEIRNRYRAFQEHQDLIAGKREHEESGRRFVNVFDASPETIVEVDGLGHLLPLDPFAESNRGLSPHYFELPENCELEVLRIKISEDGWEETVEI